MRFIWDARKAAGNVKRHGASFEEASTALADDHALAGADPDHSEGESRWVTFGVTDPRPARGCIPYRGRGYHSHHQCTTGDPVRTETL